MKKALCVALAMAMLLLSGCRKEEEVHTVVTEYDLEEARTMIDETEWLLAWLSTRETIRRDTAENVIRRIDETMSGEGITALQCLMADTADWEDESLKELPLGNGTVAPTFYHEGVELVSAAEESRCKIDEETGECTEHFSVLTIRLAYTGDDPAFREWHREYNFHNQSVHDLSWSRVTFSGTYNLEGTLPLRPDFDPEKYLTP